MGLLRWFTKNWADTREPTHTDLAPLTTSHLAEEAVEAVKKAASTLPRWRVESKSAAELTLTRRTRLIGFIDDITVTIVPEGTGTIIHAASRSRVGIGDFGQNRRNILELWSALRTFL